MNILLETLIFLIGFNILMFIPAFIFKTDKITDLSYAISFAGTVLFLFLNGNYSVGEILLLLMILIWTTRLGGYLFIRIKKIKKDDRFNEMRGKFWSFFKFWLLQGVSVWLIMLSTTLYFQQEVHDLTHFSVVGLLIWLIGLIIETISDIQKYKFINNENNKGKWVSSGLWKYSRHPNYFGEITIWFGIFIFAMSSLSGLNILYALISPIYISFLMMFVSGIPLLEKRADDKWGNDPEYIKYKKTTSILLPWCNKKYLIFLFIILSSFLGVKEIGATVGGPTAVYDFKYNPKDESVYYIKVSYGGRGCPPELMKISLATGKSETVFSCDDGERLSSTSLVSSEINKITQDFKPLNQINLKDNNIVVDIDFLNSENYSPEVNELLRRNFTASVYQNNKKITDIAISGCRLEQPFVFAGYAIPGFDKKIILLSSAINDCNEGGYIFESLHVLGGVDNLKKDFWSNSYKGSSPLVLSEGNLVVYESDEINEKEKANSFILMSSVVFILSGILLGVLLGKLI